MYAPILSIMDTYASFEDVRLKTLPATLRQRKADRCVQMEKVELPVLGNYRTYSHSSDGDGSFKCALSCLI